MLNNFNAIIAVAMKLNRRASLLLLAVACLALIVIVWYPFVRIQQQIASVHSLGESGAQICYGYNYDSDTGQWKTQGVVRFLLQSLGCVVSPVVFSDVADVVIDEDAGTVASSSVRCNDKSIANLRLLSDLQGLSLVNCKNITDTGIANAIQDSNALKWVNFKGTAASNATVLELVSKSSIVGIGLQGTPVEDHDVVQIKKCEKLQVLDLSYTRITTSGFLQLANLKQLRVLDLSWTSLDDDAIKALSGMTHLDTLHINNTGITMNGVLLASKMPAIKHLTISSEIVSESNLDDIRMVRKNCELIIIPSSGH